MLPDLFTTSFCAVTFGTSWLSCLSSAGMEHKYLIPLPPMLQVVLDYHNTGYPPLPQRSTRLESFKHWDGEQVSRGRGSSSVRNLTCLYLRYYTNTDNPHEKDFKAGELVLLSNPYLYDDHYQYVVTVGSTSEAHFYVIAYGGILSEGRPGLEEDADLLVVEAYSLRRAPTYFNQTTLTIKITDGMTIDLNVGSLRHDVESRQYYYYLELVEAEGGVREKDLEAVVAKVVSW
jgi:hypothetical protein